MSSVNKAHEFPLRFFIFVFRYVFPSQNQRESNVSGRK